MQDGQQPAGWYHAEGDPADTVRWWDGTKWVGGPQSQGAQQQAGYVAPNASELPNGRSLADPWMRIAAAIVDAIIVIIVSIPFGVAAFAGSGGFGGGDDTFEFTTPNLGLAIVGGLITTAYVVLMNSYFSGTLGKLIVGIRIIGREGEEPLGLPLGAKRSANSIAGFVLGLIPVLGAIAGLAFAIIGIVSLVFLFTDPEHRTVMDRFADTYVVNKVS